LPVQDLYAELAADDRRNDLLLDDVVSAVAEGRSPILLTERRGHLEHLQRKLAPAVRNLVVLHGGMSAANRKSALERLATIPAGEERVVLATGRYVGEGFDDPRLDTLILALPVAWRGTVAQYAGRLHRTHAGKTCVRVHGYRDGDVAVLERMLEKRIRAYRAAGYELAEPQGARGARRACDRVRRRGMTTRLPYVSRTLGSEWVALGKHGEARI